MARRARVVVMIKSRGGDVLDGSAIYTLLKEQPARVEALRRPAPRTTATLEALAEHSRARANCGRKGQG